MSVNLCSQSYQASLLQRCRACCKGWEFFSGESRTINIDSKYYHLKVKSDSLKPNKIYSSSLNSVWGGGVLG